MTELRYTLISDGTSDRAFLPILTWLLIKLGVKCAIQSEWADLSRLPNPPKSLPEKITAALDFYSCDLLFVHRDAEKEDREKRVMEINCAIQQAEINNLPIVYVIPIRMLEAWLLFSEQAIRQAAGNPHGKTPIKLPASNTVENIPDPKSMLCKLLRDASELTGRRRKKFNERQAIHQLADRIKDFSPLHNLSAFQALRTDLAETLNSQGWL